MNRAMFAMPVAQPAVQRLAALTLLAPDDRQALDAAMTRAMPYRPRGELMTERRPITRTHLVLSGWAARVRILLDGRRQFLSFVLPGDLIGQCRQQGPIASSTVVAITEVTTCAPPDPATCGLAQAYAVSAALEESYLLAHIARLGRMSALERIQDLFLELHERLTLNGMARGGSYDLPITQEILADALGLTAVHVNRMLQVARRQGDLTWSSGILTIANPASLAQKVGRAPAVVTGTEPVPRR